MNPSAPSPNAAPATPEPASPLPAPGHRPEPERLQAILGALPDLLFIMDRHGRILEYNAPVREQLYVSPEQFLGRTMDELLPEPAAAIVQRAIEDACANGHHKGSVYPLTTPAGNQWFEMSIAAQGDLQTPEGRLVAIVRDVTARQQAEETMRIFKESVENASDAVGMSTPEGKHYYQNRSFDELFGVVGENPTETLYVKPEVGREVFRTIMSGKQWSGEVQMRARDGRTLDILLRAYANRDEHGRITALIGIHTDITARQQAEDALRASEAKYRLLHETMRDAFCRVDMAGRILEVNPSFQVMTGYSAEELQQMTYRDLTPAKWHAMEAKIVAEQILPLGYSNIYEKEYIRSDGIVVPIELRTILERDGDGQPLGMWAIIRDIAPRRQIEEALRKAAIELERRVQERTAELETSKNALARSEQQFREMAESIREIFWLMDARTRNMLYLSPAYEQLTGQLHSPCQTGFENCFPHIHPDDRDRCMADIENALTTGDLASMEFRIVRPDGSIRWVENHGRGIRAPDGAILRLAGVMRDITDRRRLEAEILKAAEAERQRIGRDLHDSLGQTLTGIGYLAEALHQTLARQSHPEAPEAAKLAHLIEDAAAKAHAMARSMLMVDLKRSGLPAVLQELAFRAQEMLGAECRYTGLVDIAWIDPEVAGQLYRIAQEAVTNAVKHARGACVEIGLVQYQNGLLLSVRDDGPGLPAASSTSGLGLDIMRYRAGLIGARLWMVSSAEHGTTVNCLLPLPSSPPEPPP